MVVDKLLFERFHKATLPEGVENNVMFVVYPNLKQINNTIQINMYIALFFEVTQNALDMKNNLLHTNQIQGENIKLFSILILFSGLC